MKSKKGSVILEYIITFIIAGFAIVAVVHLVSMASETRGKASNDSKRNPVPCMGTFGSSEECF